ncbi:MAG: amidohydrolase family protein [Robiginitalea sp.]
MKINVFFLLFLILFSCGQVQEEVSPTAVLLQNVHVVDVINGTLLENYQVVVDSGRILKLATEIPFAEDYSVIVDGKEGYVVPGLTEMHAHIPSPPTSEQRIEETLYLYLAGGITTIRGMLGHPYHIQLREEVMKGSIPGPRIFTSSPSLNGNTVPTAEEAVKKVRQYASQGYDFLKIHPGIKRDVFDSLAATARKEGIPFAGHVPVDVGIRHALESGYATIDHVDGYLEGLVPESAGVQPEENGFFGFNFTSLTDTARMGELMDLTRTHEVWVVPTQSLFERWFAPTTADSLLSQPEMKYMPVKTLQNWKRIKEQYMEDPAWDPQQWKTFDAIRLELISRLLKEGHGLLLGSDAPQLFNVPGFSIHHEIDGMERAGLTPLQILQIGTIEPARYFGQQDHWGSVEEGKSADFILVRGNPLEDLDALQDLEGIMVRGAWYPKEVIAKKLEMIAGNAAGGQ